MRAAQWWLEGLSHRGMAVSMAASGPLARRLQCSPQFARFVRERRRAGKRAERERL